MSTVTRYVIIGAGAVGVTFAAELQRAGKEVLLIARSPQLEALRAGTLRYARPGGTRNLSIPVAASPDDVALTAGDVLVLATKTQDAEPVLADWAWRPVPVPVAAGAGRTRPAADVLPVVTLQNGLEAERAALRRFATVLGGVLWVAASYTAPGEVAATNAPDVAIAWLGAYPRGSHPRLAAIAADFREAGILTHVVAEIQHVKAAKLTASVTFALSALYQPGELREAAARLLHDEARDVLTSSGFGIADLAADTADERGRVAFRPTEGPQYTGNSTSQSLTRSSPVETDFLNGEIVLAARLLGRDAPVNRAVTERVHRARREGTAAGTLDDKDLIATLPQLATPPLATPPLAGVAADDVLIDAKALRDELASHRPPAVLDVRWALGDPDGRLHYRDGHLPDAVYADLDSQLAAPPNADGTSGRHPLPAVGDLQAAARSWGIGQGQPVVVYDNGGGLAAARAWWLLRWAGIASVRILDGALASWIAAGYPLESGDGRPRPGDVVLSPGHLPVLTADEAAAFGADPEAALLDARAGERYRGETEPVDRRAGHIPGAVSAPAVDNLAADGRFAAPGALRARFAALGAADAARVGVYCGSGVTAAHEIAALRIAGIDAALYPGSWSAWSADPSRPIATGDEEDNR